MLEVAQSILVKAIGSPRGIGGCGSNTYTDAYERVVGIECRGVPAMNSSSSSSHGFAGFQGPWPTDVLIASYDGRDTRVEAMRCTFSRNSAEREARRSLVVFSNIRRDIVQASLSDLGPNSEQFLSFTERHQCPLQRRVSEMSGAAASSCASPQRQDSTLIHSADPEYVYQLFLTVIGTSVFLDCTAPERQQQINANPGALPPNHYCQVGYMLRPEPKGSIFWLRACDHSVSGLQIKELCYNRKKDTLEAKGLLEWNLAQHQLWHQWDPFTQRVMFWAALPYYKFRVVRICGHPEKRRCEFEENIPKLKYPLFPGKPLPVPWGTGNCTSCVKYHIIVLPIRYECDTEDYAMCRQLLPSSSNFLTKIICTISLLRNYVDSIEIEIDLERPLCLPENFRVSFLFINGMIAIYLPNVFTHYVDVSHKEAVPKYLFGINCEASLPPTNMNSTLPSPRRGGGTTAGPSISSTPQAGSMETKGGISTSSQNLPGTRGSGPNQASIPAAGSSGHNSNPTNTTIGMHTNTTDSMISNDSGADSSSQQVFLGYGRDVIITLPVPSGNWILTPDTISICNVFLTKTMLWKFIADKLLSISGRSSSSSTGGGDGSGRQASMLIPGMAAADLEALHNALHVVTSHFVVYSRPSLPPGASGALLLAAHTRGDEYFANQLKRILVDHWRDIRPSFLTQLIIGEAYFATRLQCKALGNAYYLCVGMCDERALRIELEEQHLRERTVHYHTHVMHQQRFAVRSPFVPTAGGSGMLTGGLGNTTGSGVFLGSGDHGPAGVFSSSQGSMLVRSESKRETDNRIKDLCHNTDPDWWLIRGIKQNTSLFGRIKAFGKTIIMPIQRISITEGSSRSRGGGADGGGGGPPGSRSGSSGNLIQSASTQHGAAAAATSAHCGGSNNNNGSYTDVIACRLRLVGVPPAQAAQVAAIFEGAVNKIVEEIIEAVSKPDEDLPIRTQFHFLHNVSIAVHSLGVRAHSELTDRFARLAACSLPAAAMLHGLKSGLYAPSIATLESAFPDLKATLLRFTIRYGQKLSDRDVAAAQKTSRVPLTVNSPTHVTVNICGSGCDQGAVAAEAGSSKKEGPPAGRRVTLPRYDRCLSGARPNACLEVASYSVFRKWTLMNVVSGATEAERSTEKKEYVLSAFEGGPTMQMSCRRGGGGGGGGSGGAGSTASIPRDLNLGLGDFAAWKQLAMNRGNNTNMTRQQSAVIGGSNYHNHNSSSASLHQLLSTTSSSFLVFTDTMRRERAREALQYAMSPFENQRRPDER